MFILIYILYVINIYQDFVSASKYLFLTCEKKMAEAARCTVFNIFSYMQTYSKHKAMNVLFN